MVPKRWPDRTRVRCRMNGSMDPVSTVLHRREGGPSSIYFAPASQAACDPVAVRRAEHFGIGGVFLH